MNQYSRPSPTQSTSRSARTRAAIASLARGAVAALATAACLIGCSSQGSGYEPGRLGNGGFYFSCDDAVACVRYSNDASKFPKAVSLGSTFDVRFAPKTSSDAAIRYDERAENRGITVASIGDYVSRGPHGLVGLKLGYATLAARDAAGTLIDYVPIRVAKPDALIVYSANDTRTDPSPVDRVELRSGDRTKLRAFAQEKKEVLAGSLQVEWISKAPAIADIETTDDGTATIVARSVGDAEIIATGGTFEQRVIIEVSQ